MAATFLLDNDTWDLLVDANGNLAVATAPYAMAQDVASACRLFRGEDFYDTSRGIPYFQEVLGQLPPLSLLKSLYVSAALTVPGVVSAVCYIDSIEGRKVTGQIQSTDTAGNLNTSGF